MKLLYLARAGRLTTLAAALVGLLVGAVNAAQPTDLEAGFRSPPRSARPLTWWHWMNGNVSREGITLDLEAMKQVGEGGAMIFDVSPGSPQGPVEYASKQWRALVKHAMTEAHRLGLEMYMHNCAGWSSSGGPWIGPEHAMQMLVVSETRVEGPKHFDAQLPQPPVRLGYYRDIAVIAFPTPRAEIDAMAERSPRVTASDSRLDTRRLVDGNPGTAAVMHIRPSKEPQYVQFEFDRPFTARALTIFGSGHASGELQVSADGSNFRKIAGFRIGRPGILRPPFVVGFPPATGRFFRLVFVSSDRRHRTASLAEVTLEAGYRISNWPAKAGYLRAEIASPATGSLPADVVIDRDRVVDLTGRMSADGRLSWDVPAGHWTILRFGHTPTGKTNHPSPPSGLGLECDKLSRQALEVHFNGMVGKVISDIGALAGKTFTGVLIDSYEVGEQNWTPLFREEFRRLRGYDLLPFLPAMTGRVVESLEVSERFLWDVRRTIGDLFAENYFGYFAELCHRHGMILAVEPYGNGGFNCLTVGGKADFPMSEFWVGGWGSDNQCSKLASSSGHTYGHRIIGAEAFTASPQQGRWQNYPYKLKALGDLIFCGGVNRFVFHRYAHQPWRDLRPGMTMGPFGIHFERTNTWWEQSKAWLQYLARCQYLLQAGLFVADLCYFNGEHAPSNLPARSRLRPPPPEGYDYDGCDDRVLLTRMSVRDGRIVLPDGMSYRLLVIRPGSWMTPEVAGKLRELVRAGAAIYGPPPAASPSLRGYPDCDRQVQAIADELWGPCDGKKVTRHRLGQGYVFYGEPLDEVLQSLGVPPDFQVTAARDNADIRWIHRRAGQADIYFVSNQLPRSEVVECSFRVTGRVPELWHPDTGLIQDAPVYRFRGGRTRVTLRLDPAGSVFVVFRRPARAADPIVSLTRNGQPALATAPASPVRLEIRKAVYGLLTGSMTDAVDVTEHLRKMVRDNKLSVRASNRIAGDPAPNVVKQLFVRYRVGEKVFTKIVDENQVLTIPARGEGPGALEILLAVYGILPDNPADALKPRVVDVTEILRQRVKNNTLTVKASNSLAGDPAPLIVKQMRVDYLLGGQPYSITVRENQTLTLPLGTEPVLAAVEVPPPELKVGEKGQPVLIAWQPGTYEAATASGKRLRAVVAELSKPLRITGPWQVRFPPGLGAPESAVFSRLMSWTESDVPGIKYFSGTATYLKRINIPARLLRRDRVLALDLGAVAVIARVWLNGQDLGILWKPPFRADITKAARPGDNLLQVEVTNLWPNRLIGDEQLPDDADFLPSGQMKQLPAWLTEGKPRPKTGRVTFTTWKFYTKDSPLLQSGLLGPVRLLCGRKVLLEGD